MENDTHTFRVSTKTIEIIGDLHEVFAEFVGGQPSSLSSAVQSGGVGRVLATEVIMRMRREQAPSTANTRSRWKS